ncbi:hypothetical protein SUGI_0528180 [Cryptomeria japonica]|nr:hypothetical protein SUGI_0528180 [Cryptomeria japonica]
MWVRRYASALFSLLRVKDPTSVTGSEIDQLVLVLRNPSPSASDWAWEAEKMQSNTSNENFAMVFQIEFVIAFGMRGRRSSVKGEDGLLLLGIEHSIKARVNSSKIGLDLWNGQQEDLSTTALFFIELQSQCSHSPASPPLDRANALASSNMTIQHKRLRGYVGLGETHFFLHFERLCLYRQEK